MYLFICPILEGLYVEIPALRDLRASNQISRSDWRIHSFPATHDLRTDQSIYRNRSRLRNHNSPHTLCNNHGLSIVSAHWGLRGNAEDSEFRSTATGGELLPTVGRIDREPCGQPECCNVGDDKDKRTTPAEENATFCRAVST